MLRWGAAAAHYAGDADSGDRFLVKTLDHGALVAVVDALGHGRRAAQDAAAAIDVLERQPHDSLAALIELCHDRLRESHGATISLAAFDWRSHCLTWLGVGNVAGVLAPQGLLAGEQIQHLLVRGGVVGVDLPDLQPSMVMLVPGDLLIMATDGIEDCFADQLPEGLNPQALADHILHHFAKETDDALVLVLRYGQLDDE